MDPTEKKSPGVSSRLAHGYLERPSEGLRDTHPSAVWDVRKRRADEGDQRAQGQMREGDLAQARSYEVVPGTHRLPRGLAETLCRETFRRRDVSTAPRTGNGRRSVRVCLLGERVSGNPPEVDLAPLNLRETTRRSRKTYDLPYCCDDAHFGATDDRRGALLEEASSWLCSSSPENLPLGHF